MGNAADNKARIAEIGAQTARFQSAREVDLAGRDRREPPGSSTISMRE